MKKKLSWLLLLSVIAGSIAMVSCKKAAEQVINSVDNTNVQKAKTQASDENFVSGEFDQSENDVHNTASANARVNPNGSVATSNGCPTDTSWSTIGGTVVLTINYHGLLGQYRYRTGSITVQFISGKRWTDSGAVVIYTFNNYTVQNRSNGKSVTFNGNDTITNLSGGNMFTITLPGNTKPLIYKTRAHYTVGFTDSGSTVIKTAYWNFARKTTAQYLAGLYNFSTSGDGGSNLESWGTTRNGDSYSTIFNTPVTSDNKCGLAGIYRPTAGNVTHYVASFPYNITYGLDATGSPVTPTSGCVLVYYYQVSCVILTGTYTTLIPY